MPRYTAWLATPSAAKTATSRHDSVHRMPLSGAIASMSTPAARKRTARKISGGESATAILPAEKAELHSRTKPTTMRPRRNLLVETAGGAADKASWDMSGNSFHLDR